jgi:hypothetical protein
LPATFNRISLLSMRGRHLPALSSISFVSLRAANQRWEPDDMPVISALLLALITTAFPPPARVVTSRGGFVSSFLTPTIPTATTA